MKQRLIHILIVLAIVVLCLLPASRVFGANDYHDQNLTQVTNQAGIPENLPTDQIIIQYKANARLDRSDAAAAPEQMQKLSQATGVQLDYFRVMSGRAHVLKLPKPLPERQVKVIAARLQTLSTVEYAEPDSINQAIETSPNDPNYANGSQWHLREGFGINANLAWDVTRGDPNLVIAVIDTGILAGHFDIQGRTLFGYDFISNAWSANDGDGQDANPEDPGDWDPTPGTTCRTQSTWHGTHVAGTIGATTNNGQGVAGINWNSRILPVRVLGRCGGTESDIVDGIRWSVGMLVLPAFTNPFPARVLNLSLGASGKCSITYQNAINDARSHNAVVVVAAGNNNDDALNYKPANCDGVITVGATDNVGAKASFSNFGVAVEISAPGVNVMSTTNNGTTTPNQNTTGIKQGTSQAAPHVAGVISLLLSLRPELTPDQVNDVIRQHPTYFPIGSSCYTIYCGSGIVNADNVVRDLYVNRNYHGDEIGTAHEPYNTLNEAYNRAWDGARLNLPGGYYAERTIYDKPMTIEALNGGVVTLGK